jgi:HK97 family phage portal protein
MPQPPNRLGAVLGYMSSAYRYAAGIEAPSKNARQVYAMLDNMVQATRYTGKDTVDTAAAIKLAITSAWFYSGTKLIADRICSSDAQFVVKQRTDALEEIKNHEFLRLMERPNSLMTGEFLKRYLTFWAHLSGNAYIFISTPGPGVGPVQELWPLPSNMIRPMPERMHSSRLTGHPCIDYLYEIGGKKTILPGENVIHLRFANPFDYWHGLSPLTALIGAVRTDFVQSRYLHGFFGRDNAVPTAIISLPQETSNEDFEIAKQQIREQFGEGRRSAVTRAGDLTVQTITQTIQQMEIINARKFNREEINHVLGIPEGILSGGQSGDSRLSTEITFARNTVQPWLDMLAGEMTANLAPYYGYNIVISAPSVIPQDRAMKVNEFNTYSNDRTVDENRKELNLPPILDVIPHDRQEEMAWLTDMTQYVPVRLLSFIQSNTFAGDGGVYTEDPSMIEGQALGNNIPKAKTGGDSDSGVVSPKRNQQLEGDGKKLYKIRAMKIGQREELMRWRKIAIKEAKSGRDPSLRAFETEALPEELVGHITQALIGAEELHIGTIFDTCANTIDALDLVA